MFLTRTRVRCAAMLSVAALLVVAASSPASASTGGAHIHHTGGSHGTIHVVEAGAAWPTLDPATNNQEGPTTAIPLMNAIYGGLFEFGPGGKIVPDLATGYSLGHGNRLLEIRIRPGVRFANGMPLTAADVAASMKRDLKPSYGCICDADFKLVSSVTSSGDKVVVHLSAPDSAIVRTFDDTAPNWPVPMALVKTKAEAKRFEQHPVGAGPFGKVISNTASASVTMAANPHYWKSGEPKLAKMVFTSVGADQSAYASLETGQSQVAYYVTTIPVIRQAIKSSAVKVLKLPATFYEFVSFNTKVAPFNNYKARLALLYATDAPLLVKSLYAGLYNVTEGPTAPGEPFYETTVPGYPTYNLAKAKALVKQLGGLSFRLATTENSTTWTTEASYLSGMWSKAGIHASVEPNSLSETLVQLKNNNWSALLSNWGAVDPAIALPTYFGSDGPFSGVHSAGLDALMNAGVAAASPSARKNIYEKIDRYMAKNALADFLYSKPEFVAESKNVRGISSHQSDIFWGGVTVK